MIMLLVTNDSCLEMEDQTTSIESFSRKELMTIPGIGKSIASDLLRIGIKSITDLKGKDPEVLYQQSNDVAGVVQDRCLLYVFRCAVYFASTTPARRRSEKLKWWNWKDVNVRGNKKSGNNYT